MTNTMLGLLAAIVLIPILAEASRGDAGVGPGASKPLAMQAGFGGIGAPMGSPVGAGGMGTPGEAGTIGTGAGGTVGTGEAGIGGGGTGGMGGTTGAGGETGTGGTIGTGSAGTIGTGAGGYGMNNGATPLARNHAKSRSRSCAAACTTQRGLAPSTWRLKRVGRGGAYDADQVVGAGGGRGSPVGERHGLVVERIDRQSRRAHRFALGRAGAPVTSRELGGRRAAEARRRGA
jgi:hypothetical protein